MTDRIKGDPFRSGDDKALKKKIHRALVEARSARYRGDEAEVERIIRETIVAAAPAAMKAGREGSFNWVVEALRPLDEMLLPD